MEDAVKPDRAHAWLTARLTVGGLGSEPYAGKAPTRCLAGQFMAGDSVRLVAFWWEVTEQNVEDAIRLEYALARRQKWAVRWRDKLAADAEKNLKASLRKVKKARARAASKP